MVFSVKLEKLKSQLNGYGFIEIEEAVTGGVPWERWSEGLQLYLKETPTQVLFCVYSNFFRTLPVAVTAKNYNVNLNSQQFNAFLEQVTHSRLLLPSYSRENISELEL